VPSHPPCRVQLGERAVDVLLLPGRPRPQRGLVEPGDRGGGDQGADQPHRVRDQPGGLPQARVDEPGRHDAARQVREQELRPLDRDMLEDRQVDRHRRQPRPDRQRRVRHPGRAGRDVHLPAPAPGPVQVMLVPPGRLRLRDVLLLIRPGDAQVSGIRQVSAALAVPLREVADDLVRLAPAHRRSGRPGLLPRLPLPLRPFRGAPPPAGRRPAVRQVIAARRHRGVPRVPGRAPRGRLQLPPQLGDQRRQHRDLLILIPEPRCLPADQRITRILRRQRLGHATRSSPKPAPAAARHPARSATVTSESVTAVTPKRP